MSVDCRPAAAGCISTTEESIAEALSRSAAFLEFVCEEEAAGALERRIHVGELPDPADGDTHTPVEMMSLRPFGLVGVGQSEGLTRRRVTADGYGLAISSTVQVILERNVERDRQTANAYAYRDFVNSVGRIIDELMTDELLDTAAIELYEGPARTAPSQRAGSGDFQWAVLQVMIGDRR